MVKNIKKFVAQSASESEDEKAVEKRVFDSSEEEEEEDEEMTKEDMEFLKEAASEDESGSASVEGSTSSAEESPEELSDDDLDLIEENLGKRRAGFEPIKSRGKNLKGQGKFKRLRRRNEIESSEDEEERENENSSNEAKIAAEKTKQKKKDLQNLFNDEEEEEAEEEEEESDDDLRDFIEEEEDADGEEGDDDLPETIEAAQKNMGGVPRRRAIIDDREAPKRALSSALASGQISKDAWNEMMEIFGDGTDYLDLIVESGDEDQEQEKEKEAKSINNLEDDTTDTLKTFSLVSDVPERFNDLNIKIVSDDSELEAFLQKESAFIAKKIHKLCPADSFSGLTSAILSILRFVHCHGLEVPFIATYRREYFFNFFGINEIWTILDEDFKYRQIEELKKSLKTKIGSVEENFYSFIIEGETEEAQLKFIQEFLIKERRRPQSKQEILLNFAHKLVPSAVNFAENLRNRRVLHGPLILSEREMELEAVEVVAREAANTVEGALSGVVNVLAEEFGSNPRLFSEVRDLLFSQATLTVTPTALGSIEISHDPTHYLLPLQYIAEKTISTFIEDQGLALARGLETKLISVEFGYGKNLDELLNELKNFLPGIEKIKEQVFHLTWQNHWKPRLNRLVLQKLRNEAENWIAHFSQFYFQEKLMAAPLNQVLAGMEDDEVAITSINFVKEVLYIAELDKNGRVLRQEAVKTKHTIKPEVTLKKSLNQLNSSYVVISGEGQDCLELYRGLRESEPQNKSSIMWGCDDTAQIYKTSMRSAREFPECSTELKYAVAVGRRMLNPVAEYAMMTDDELLQLPLHPLQTHLPRALRLKHLHRGLVNVINLLGAAINELILPGLKQSILSYVSGLGPIKAAQLVKKLGNKWLNSRAELITQYEMGRRTFTNCSGFLKITAERIKKGSGKKKYSVEGYLIEPLDGTRIHPESYELARKMAADALELDDPTAMQRRQEIFGDDDEVQDESERTATILANAINQVMKEPKKLDDLLLRDYAKEIERLKNLPKHVTLKDIKSELQGPFPDPRVNNSNSDSSKSASVNQVVKMLTGKDETWWYLGRPVTIKFLSPTSRKLANLLDGNGLIVGVDGDIPRNMRPGAPVNAYLTRIDLKRLVIDVSLRKPDNQEELLTQFVNFDPFYDFQRATNAKNEAQSSNISSNVAKNSFGGGQEMQNGRCSARQLSHPAFKALNREESERFLALAPVGEILIRPSSQKRVGGDLPGDLTLTWKAGPGLFSHVPLGEADRPSGQDWLLGRTLMLPGLIPSPDGKMKVDRFEDLDEIVGRRIEPVVSLLQEAQGCPKYFSNPSSDAINVHLRDQSILNPGRIPYCITLAPEPNCGHLVLSHPSGSRRELIRVDPRGYAIIDPKTKEVQVYERIEKIVDYFKRNYKNFSERLGSPQHQVNATGTGNVRKDPRAFDDGKDPRNSKYQQFAN
jgi:transcription elongation factor SPT6